MAMRGKKEMKKKTTEYTVDVQGGDQFPSIEAAIENSMPHLLDLLHLADNPSTGPDPDPKTKKEKRK
jgi:hypothetical protein